MSGFSGISGMSSIFAKAENRPVIKSSTRYAEVLRLPQPAKPRFGNAQGPDDELTLLRRQVADLKAQLDVTELAKRVVPATASIVMYGKPKLNRSELALLNRKAEANQHRPSGFDNPFSSSSQSLNHKEIEQLLEGQMIGSGSAFWIQCKDGKPRLLTNAHVVNVGQKIKFQIPGLNLPVLAETKSTGLLNTLKTLVDFEKKVKSKAKPQEIDLQIAQTFDGKPAVSTDYDLALLEPVDPAFYIRKGSAYKLPNGIQPLEFVKDFTGLEPGSRIAKVGNSGGFGQGNLSVGHLDGFESSRHATMIGVPDSMKADLERFETEKEFMILTTDLNLYGGDSGGPLVNMEGKVIGVNYSVPTTEKGTTMTGLGRAIAAPVAKAVLAGWGF